MKFSLRWEWAGRSVQTNGSALSIARARTNVILAGKCDTNSSNNNFYLNTVKSKASTAYLAYGAVYTFEFQNPSPSKWGQVHNLSCENEFFWHENEKSFPCQRLSTYPRFNTEARGKWLIKPSILAPCPLGNFKGEMSAKERTLLTSHRCRRLITL